MFVSDIMTGKWQLTKNNLDKGLAIICNVYCIHGRKLALSCVTQSDWCCAQWCRTRTWVLIFEDLDSGSDSDVNDSDFDFDSDTWDSGLGSKLLESTVFNVRILFTLKRIQNDHYEAYSVFWVGMSRWENENWPVHLPTFNPKLDPCISRRSKITF